MMTTLTFIGLGNMGTPMALNLLKSGLQINVWNRSQEKASPLVKEGAKLLKQPRDAFEQAPLVISMVANDAVLEDLTLGPNGIIETIKPGSVHISMSTIAPETSRKLAKIHQDKGAFYLAAPVFGRPEAAAARKLWICQSGAKEAKEKAKPILEKLGQKVYDFGTDPGSANAVKISGNFMILSAITAMSDAFSYLEKNNIDRESMASFLVDSLFPSPVYQTYGKIIAQKKFSPAGFKLTLGLKDINLLLKSAETLAVPLPIASVLRDRLIAAIANNHGDFDWSAL